MIPNYILKENREIGDAFTNMLQEELDKNLRKKVQKAVNVFVKKHSKQFKDIKAVKKTVADIAKAEDEAEIVNLIAALSGQLEDSEKYTNEIDKLLALVA